MAAPILPTENNPFPWGRARTQSPPAADPNDLPIAVSCLDLTTLNATDTPATVRAICEFAKEHNVAAVVVYPLLIAEAASQLENTKIKVVAAAGGFPHGLTPIEAKLVEIRFALDRGADEIDVVMNRSAFLAGEYPQVFDEIAAMKAVCGSKTMKLILETGELPDLDAIRNASFIAMQAGADFIKTSTGKIAKGATPEATLCIANAIKDYHEATSKKIGVKPSGGIKTESEAATYVAVVRQTLGDDWLDVNLFRIGASRVFQADVPATDLKT